VSRSMNNILSNETGQAMPVERINWPFRERNRDE
jgi:hypothetical protein